MRYWTADDIADGAKLPVGLAGIIARVLGAIDTHGTPETRLVRVGRTDDEEEDYNRLEVDIELAPGIVLPTPYGRLEGIAEGWEDENDDAEGLTRDVIEGIKAAVPLIEPIADMLHDLRRRSRIVIASWQRAGLPAELIDVRLAPVDHWRGQAVPNVVVLFRGLNDRLQQDVVEVPVETHDELEKALSDHRYEFETRNDARTALSEHGATGRIDQLAINAITHSTDLAAILRMFSSEWRLWLNDGTAIMMRDGHLTANAGGDDENFEWSGDQVILTSMFISQAQLDAAVGQPVSALIDHPLLTPDIIVTEARSTIDHGQPIVQITFDQPRRLFCAITGRVWDEAALS